MAYDPVSHDLVLIGGARVQGSPFDGGVSCSSVGSSGSGSASGSSGVDLDRGATTFIPPANGNPGDRAGAERHRWPRLPPVPVLQRRCMQNTVNVALERQRLEQGVRDEPVGGLRLVEHRHRPRLGSGAAARPAAVHRRAGPAGVGAAPAMACPMPANGNLHVVEPACPCLPHRGAHVEMERPLVDGGEDLDQQAHTCRSERSDRRWSMTP